MALGTTFGAPFWHVPKIFRHFGTWHGLWRAILALDNRFRAILALGMNTSQTIVPFWHYASEFPAILALGTIRGAPFWHYGQFRAILALGTIRGAPFWHVGMISHFLPHCVKKLPHCVVTMPHCGIATRHYAKIVEKSFNSLAQIVKPMVDFSCGRELTRTVRIGWENEMGNLRYGNYDLGACKTMESCDKIAAEIAGLMANETDDHIRACMADERRRFTNKSWGFRNPGGKNGTVNSPRASRKTVAPVLGENQIIVDLPVCDSLTQITVAQMIRDYAAQIDPTAVRLAQMIADRKILDAQIAAAQKTAKTAKTA